MAASKEEPNKTVEDKPEDLQKTVDHVVRTWELVNKDALKHGIVFYKRLFTTHPEVIKLFSFSSEVTEKMEDSPGLQKQANSLMSMIDYAVSQLGNLPELVPQLKELGAKHVVEYHTKPEHFKPVGECLLWTLKEGLGELFTPEVEMAWTSIYKIIADTMIEGGKEELGNASA
ncbi:neuroglobin-like [Dendronephthya gigantea]|uniref:neuroglobin-like n=1 Tax=Dendronephthya gigantea TaxID=151771 RepID=UPI001069FAAE|nr:neuroglobin-like [Dendronephthya gigantea]XP_028398784.1 neuroglobin-like [Dendronephthya gigantea]XP_028398785.1 neuroglobin-like [Dendronephthya gigantea]XP_028398786.1 neuroglobin-like [Dendronephthya gigantea]